MTDNGKNGNGIGSTDSSDGDGATIEIGILTKGKPTLSLALGSLLLQENRNIRIHIVDTSASPVIKRDDVVFALRLAFDREISCGYEHIRERRRAFSVGRLKLLESLKGPHVCFMDDDVVMASSTLAQMLPVLQASPGYGFIAPFCKNAGFVGGHLAGVPHFSPGGIFYQDAVVRNILIEYYNDTIDVLDEQKANGKVWEISFLTELFTLLNRKCTVLPDMVTYHLDYREQPNYNWDEAKLVQASTAKARELVSKHATYQTEATVGSSAILETI